jgi:Putative adhesin
MADAQTAPVQERAGQGGLWLRLGGAFTVLVLLMTCFSVWSWLSRGVEHDSRAFPVQAARLVIDLSSGGDLTLSTGRPGRVQVNSDVTWSVSKPKVAWSYDDGVLRLQTAGYLSPFGHFSDSFSVLVPPDMPVDVRSGSGDITAVDLAGDLKLDTGTGTVAVYNPAGRLDLSDGSGDVVVSGASSSVVNAGTSSGNVRLSFEAAPLAVNASTSSGDVRVAVPAGTRYSVQKETQSGSLDGDVTSYPGAANTISARTYSGTVTVSYSAPFTPSSASPRTTAR